MNAHIDFETRSGVDLRKTGAHKYAEHRSTDIMCLGFAFDDEPAVVARVCLPEILPALTKPASQADWIRLLEHVQSGGTCTAHNAPFELQIWNNVGVRKYGWPTLRPEQMSCTMARAYAASLPGNLDGVRAAVGITQEKDLKGGRLMLKMSQPKTRAICNDCDGQGVTLDAGVLCLCPMCDGCGEYYTWHEEPEQIRQLFAYCATDVDVERHVDKRVPQLQPQERAVWLLDYKINNRGVMVDVPNVRRAQTLVEFEEERLDESMRAVTQQGVATTRAHVQLKNWLTSKGVENDGVAKHEIASLLARKSLSGDVRAALEIRQEASKSSTAKLGTMLDRASTDDRLKGIHQYHGANTGRWAGRGVQTQNFPRPKIKQKEIDEVFLGLTGGMTAEYMTLFHGAPMQVLSDCLRGFLVPPPGRLFYAVDFNSIESRVRSWLAGQEDALEIFRTHGKMYEHQAAQTFRCLIEEITKDDPRRQVGKVEDLALGFGGGVGALQAMCQAYGILLEPVFDTLWQLARAEQRDRAVKRYASEVTKALNKRNREIDKALKENVKPPRPLPVGLELGITKKEWLASELVKLSWREANPQTVAYWNLIETAAMRAVITPGETVVVSPDLPFVHFKMNGSFLTCLLPSGRRLCYPYPEVRTAKTEWGQDKLQLTYKTEDSTTRKWIRCPTYGGSLLENVVQAVARDALADAMVRVDAAGHDIVMHVHDEIVTEAEASDPEKHLRELTQLVLQRPAWASGLPIAAEGWFHARYRK